jgi:hypothetical protein
MCIEQEHTKQAKLVLIDLEPLTVQILSDHWSAYMLAVLLARVSKKL